LGYLSSDYRSDLEDKLQTYNKLNDVYEDVLEKK
jgi:hypothetical protein